MGRYLDLARQALADLKDGPMNLSAISESPQSDNGLGYERNESNEKRVSPTPWADSVELSSWADPTNPDVRAARAKARRLGVLDVRFPANPVSPVLCNLDVADESMGVEAMWTELEKMPPLVLRDRASRTDDPETKRRLLDLAQRTAAAVQAGVNNEDGDAIAF